MEEYKQLTKNTDNNNIGLAIQMLVDDNIKKINTSFIAEIVSINGNKVSVKKKIKDKATDKDTVYNNCMVGFSQSGFWQEQFKLKVGDDGIAFVMQDDVSNYKSTGKGGTNPSGRILDKNDSVFIPLSLFETLPNDDINWIIKSLDGKCRLEFTNDNIGILHADLLTLKSANTTLKTKLRELAEILDSAMILQTPSGIQPFDGTTRSNFSNWKTSLNNLFKD